MTQIFYGYPVAQEAEADILALPYQGNVSMVIILPKVAFGLPAIEAGLSNDELNHWLADASDAAQVNLSMPKFRVTTSADLQAPLAALGVRTAFLSEADLTGIGAQGLHLSGAWQKTFIDVNESGTEAAGVTGMSSASASFGGPVPVDFTADHPFLYLIRANATGAILFIGRVDNPAAD